MKPLRVAQVVRPAAGGMRRHVSLLLAHLDRERFKPTLFAPADYDAGDLPPGVEHIPINISPGTNPLRDFRSIGELAQKLTRNFDIVHAHGLRGALIGVSAAHRAGIPAVFTAHNLVPEPNELARFFITTISKRSARAIAVSGAVFATLWAAGAFSNTKIEVIPNGIDLAPFDAPVDIAAVRAQYGIPPDAPLVVAIGRLSHEKGFDLLIQALSFLRAGVPNAKLLLVGDGPQRSELALVAERLQLSPTFTGAVPNVAPILRAADVVAVPSREEGQGIVALEAMACRKPVVAFAVGGLTETILPNETGLLVELNFPSALADALAELLADPTRRREMGETGRARVEAEYTVEAMVERIQTLYDAIAK